MHIGFVTQDEALAREWVAGGIREEDRLHWFQQPEALNEALETLVFDYIAISDRFFELSGLSDYLETLRERVPDAAVTVLLSDRHDANETGKWIKMCVLGGFHYVPPHRTKEAITDAMLRRFYGSGSPMIGNGGELIVFVGSTPNIGTTFVSFGTAVGMASRSDRTVGYLCLNLKSSKLHRYIGIDKPESSLDQLRAEILSRGLRPERLMASCETVKGLPNLRVLFGNQLREQAEYFTAEDIEHVLQTAKQTFDICIVEVNAYWDNAATLCALLQADSRILVTTPELTHFQEDTDRWLRGLCPVVGLAADSFDLVLTQCEAGGIAGIRQSDIRKETGLSLIGKVGKYADLAATVNQGKLLELLLGRHPLCRDLGGIAALLCAVRGIEPAVRFRERPAGRLLGRMFARRGKAGLTIWEG